MTKEEKFKQLDELDISRVEIEEYFAQKEKSGQPEIKPIDKSRTVRTPLPIVYQKGETLYTQPYLDLIEKEHVWGIIAGDLRVKKTYDKYGRKKDAEKKCKMEQAEPMHCKLPSLSECRRISKEVPIFNQTVLILRRYGITADMLDNNWCWCQDEYFITSSVYNFGKEKSFALFKGIGSLAFNTNEDILTRVVCPY